MKWSKFEESKRVYPDKVVNKLIKGFSNATGEILELVVEPARAKISMSTNFTFRLLLISHKLDGYKFKVATFGYNVEIYPVLINLEEQIFFELNSNNDNKTFFKGEYSNEIIQIDSEQEFEELMIKAFESERFQEVVTGLLKISKKPDLVS